MANIVHRIGIPYCSLSRLYNSIGTLDGIASWWTKEVKGIYEEDESLQFGFSKGGPEFTVLKMRSPSFVKWECKAGPKDWIGTLITFNIGQNGDDEAVLVFTHSGWKEETEFMHHCSTQWAYFLIGLKEHLAGDGSAKPYGSSDFKPISKWSQ